MLIISDRTADTNIFYRALTKSSKRTVMTFEGEVRDIEGRVNIALFVKCEK